VSSTVSELGWLLTVPHHARGARIARHRLTEALAGAVSTDVLLDAAAVAAELVGNAARHAAPLPGDVIRVAWRLVVGGGVEIRVTDGGSEVAPRVLTADPDATSGRGLRIVQALACRWGFEPEGRGQCVWAELPGIG
jgi:anti-sigma regulatory factor (Ser/Thr protein kinase)